MNTGVLSVNRLLMDTVREVVANSSPLPLRGLALLLEDKVITHSTDFIQSLVPRLRVYSLLEQLQLCFQGFYFASMP
jgi:hypothetical protein